LTRREDSHGSAVVVVTWIANVLYVWAELEVRAQLRAIVCLDELLGPVVELAVTE